MTAKPCTALILAASRGPGDPVARHVGSPNKVFVPIHGRAMLAWVVSAFRASASVRRIAVSMEDPGLLRADRELAAAEREGALMILPAGSSPGESVARALKALDEPFPVLLATADHPLLTPEMIDSFIEAVPDTCDIAVGVVRAEVIRASHPDAVRTFYRFADGAYSGSNLYLLRTPAALRAVSFWSGVEAYRKRPWRLAWEIGPFTLLRLILGTLTLEAALARLSRLIGITARAVELPFAEAAIDVDKPGDLRLVEALLGRR